MPRILPAFALFLLALAAGFAALTPGGRPQPASAAFTCGPTGSGHETHSKIQILVSGPRSDEVHWSFFVTPNPFTLVASLRVADNQAPDLNSVQSNMLLEDVCVTSAFDTYTVSVDPTVNAPCPLVLSTITRYGPGPTLPNADPDTAAFRFETQCPTPTATPTSTATPIPSATPIPTATITPMPLSTFVPTPFSYSTPTPFPYLVTPTPLPGVPLLSVTVTPLNGANSDAGSNSLIACGGSALVKVQATINGLPVPDGSVVALQATVGRLEQSAGNTVSGLYTTILDLPAGNQSTNGAVSAVVNGTYALANATSNFGAQACASQTLAVRSVGTATTITPPNTGDGGLLR